MSVLSYGIPVLLAGGLLLAGCSRQGEAQKAVAPVAAVSGVQVRTIQQSLLPEKFVAVGTVRARNSAQIASRTSGVVTGVRVKEGDRVARGQQLLSIEATEQAATAAAAQSGVEEARRALDEARARQKLAVVTYGRYSSLFREEAATRQELDSRRAERDVAGQAVDRARARVEQSLQGARAAGAVAGYSRVTAPVSGVVTAKSAAAGMTVFPGVPLLTIEESGGYRLEALVPESALASVKTGEPVEVTVDGVTLAGTGRVAEIVPAADPSTRTFTVKIDIAGPGLKSGMFGRAQFAAGSRPGLLVPKSAVIERGALTSLWVVDQERKARLRLVKTGAARDDLVEILSGLSPGETIVVSGTGKVTDGIRIEP